MSDQLLPAVNREELIRTIERERLRALVAADPERAAPLYADDFQQITPAGAVLTKAEYLGDIASRRVDYRVFEPDSEIAVRLFAGAAAIRYRSRIEFVLEDRHTPLRRYWHSNIYQQRAGRWQIVWAQATAIAD